MRMVSQDNLKNRRRSKWTIKVYHIQNGNITDEAVQKYIKEQAEESRKEDSKGTAL